MLPAYIVNDFGPKKSIFFGINSGKPQPLRTKFGTHTLVKGRNVQEILDVIVQSGQHGGSDDSRAAGFFLLLAKRDDIPATSQRPTFANFAADT